MITKYFFKKQILLFFLLIASSFSFGQETTLIDNNYQFWIGRLSENYADSNYSYIIKDNVIYRAEGDNWKSTTGNFYGSDLSNFVLNDFFVDNNNTVWLYNQTNNIISKSIDNGNTWTFINIPDGVKPLNSTQIFVRNNKLYFSATIKNYEINKYIKVLYTLDYLNGNSIWNSLPLNNSNGYSAGANSPLYQVFDDGSLWDGNNISIDNGLTWEIERFNIPVDKNPSYRDVNYVVSKDKTMIFHSSYLSNYTNYISSNGGLSYNKIIGLPYNTPLVKIDFHTNGIVICQASFNGNGNKQSTDGIYISYNHGLNFVKLNNGFNFWDNQNIDGFTKDMNYIYTSYRKNGINRIDINNTNSINLNNGVNNIVPHDIKKLDCDSKGNLYAAINGYGIFRSYDHGLTWFKDVDSSSPYSTPTNINATSNNIVYSSGYDPGIINKSANNGINWTVLGKQITPYTIVKLFVDKTDSDRIFFTSIVPGNNGGNSTYNGTFASFNGGKSFGIISGGYSTSIDSELAKDVLFENSNTIYMLFEKRIMKTIDNGKTWSKISSQLLDRIIINDISGKIYGFYINEIFESVDKGLTWNKFTPIFGNPTIIDLILAKYNNTQSIIASTKDGVFSFSLAPPSISNKLSNTTWVQNTKTAYQITIWNPIKETLFATNGSGLKEIGNKDLGSLSTSQNQFLEGTIKCYPNPTNDIVNISSQNETIKQINVYDMLGKLIKSQKGNSDNEKINIHELPNAMYLIEVKTEQTTKTMKIIKQ